MDKSISLEELSEQINTSGDDLEDVEVLCVCTGTCVLIKCAFG